MPKVTGGGGKPTVRDVRGYKPPQGPSSVNNPTSPGLHGNVYERGTQGISGFKSSEAGSPGLGGKRHQAGSQK